MTQRSEEAADHGAVPAGETRTVTLPADDVGASGTGPALQRGACLGRYVVLNAIGSGGMGNVFAAYDPELDRKVALKVLRGEHLASETREEAESRLLREARAIAKLAHPNVVAVYDVGAVGERLFVAMELIDGVTLAGWRAAERRSWREILRVFLEAGKGLAAAHRAGLVHRDFKPGNVMLAADGRVRVLDFGLARPIDRRAAMSPAPSGEPAVESPLAEPLTLPGKAVGTPAYMAPEQLDGAGADARSDQFSFCLALYEALYGEMPYGGRTVTELRHNIRHRRVREAPAEASVPGWLRRVLLRGLEPDPAARFASMDELLAALAKDPALRRRRWLVAAAVAVVSAAVPAGLFHLRSRQELLCQGAERRLQGIWDAARKAEIRAAFAATGLDYAEDSWSYAENTLDRATTAWVSMHTEVCEATHRRAEQSLTMLDRRMTCLDARLYEIRAVSDLFARADPQVVTEAGAAADNLTSLAGCIDRRALMELVPPPEDEDTRHRVEEVRTLLAESKVREDLGKYPEALAIAEEAFAAAGELGYRPLVGEAQLRLARGLGRAGRAAEMREHLLETVGIAQAAHHRELLAEAMTALIINAFLRGEGEEARIWARLARSVIEGLGERADIESRRLQYLAIAVTLEGQFEQSIEYFKTLLEVTPDLGPRVRCQALTNIGESYANLKRFEEAETYMRQALESSEESFGPDHFFVVLPLMNLGNIFLQQNELEQALAYDRRALRIFERKVAPEHPDLTQLLTEMSQALIASGRAAEAIPYLEQAVRMRELAPGDPALLARSRFHLARALWITGRDRAQARELAVAARDAFAEIGQRTQEELEEVEAWLGGIRRAGGASP
ncbi:MAG: serine/threonine protein kinase [bacterium]|nr:serine/threonine protein kinase [bacterium]